MLSREQKENCKKTFEDLKTTLQRILSGDLAGMPQEKHSQAIKRALDPELGCNKDWKAFLEVLEAELTDYDNLARLSPDKYAICKIMDWKCDLLRGHPNYKGDGQDCPEYITHFCCGFLDNNPVWRDIQHKKSLKRIVEHIIKHGVAADYLRPVRRTCKKFCPRYEECVSDIIPEGLQARGGNLRPGEKHKDPELERQRLEDAERYKEIAYKGKTIFHQFLFCLRRGEEMATETILVLDKMIGMCEA